MSKRIMNKEITHLESIESKRVPKGWKTVMLGDFIKEMKNGFASGKRDKEGIVQIRMNNVTTDGHLLLNSILRVPIPKNIEQFMLKEDDFLFNNTNSIDLVGKSAIFKGVTFPCTFSNHFTRIRFSKEMLPEWVLFNLIAMWRKGIFKSLAIRHVGQSAIQTHLLEKMILPLPPLAEQEKIVEILMTVDKAIEEVDEAIKKTQRLKEGLMQKLLTKGIGHNEFKGTIIGEIPKSWEIAKLSNIA